MVCSFINYRFPHIIQFFDKSRSHVQGNTCMRAELVVVSNCLLHFRRWKIMKEIFGGCLTSFERSNTWKAYTENLVSVKMKDHEKTQKNLDFPSIFHVRFARFLSAISRLHQHRSRKFKPHFSTRLLLWTFETMAQLVFRQLFSVPNVSRINVYREKGEITTFLVSYSLWFCRPPFDRKWFFFSSFYREMSNGCLCGKRCRPDD